MSVYVLSDLHLSLTAQKPMDIFGDRWENYHEKIESGWRSKIKENDTVIVAGDVSWAMSLCDTIKDFNFIENLPGLKLLGKGNHDYWWDTQKKMNDFLEQNNIKTIKFLYNNAYNTEGMTICGSRGWFLNQKAAPDNSDYKKIVLRESGRIEASINEAKKYNNEIILFLHFPPVYKNFICDEILTVLHKHNIKRCYYGHIHSEYETLPSFVYEGITFTITSADYLNFIPLKIDL